MAPITAGHDQDRLAAALERAASSNAHYPVSIPAAEGERLHDWVTREAARETIEIGLGYGVSALYICAGLKAAGGGRHVAMDPHQATRFEGRGLSLLGAAGVADMLEFHPRPSETVLPELLHAGRAFDFAFVDGNHRFDWVFVDLVYLGRLVRPGGIVFVDDHQLPAIRKAVAFFVANLRWAIEEVSNDDPKHVWVVLRVALEPVERDFTHFVDF